MAAQFNQYCTVCCQISVPKTQKEWKKQLANDLKDINCDTRLIPSDAECTVSEITPQRLSSAQIHQL